MHKLFFSLISLLFTSLCLSQTVTTALQKAYAVFEADTQLKHAISSLYVIDAKTGQVIFGKNQQTGLAPASTQKIITSVTAFETLGKNFYYTTRIGLLGKPGKPGGELYIEPGGDPSFGSSRYAATRPDRILSAIVDSLRKLGISDLNDHFFIPDNTVPFDEKSIPDGWIMQDIGNYYGAGSFAINWRENQYDIFLRSENVENGAVDVVQSENLLLPLDTFASSLSAGPRGSGDNAYIYLPIVSGKYLLQGSIPMNEKKFRISGAVTNGSDYFINELRMRLKKEELIKVSDPRPQHLTTAPNDVSITIATFRSPVFDSLNYWFLRKSINLYGEAFIKTFASIDKRYGSTELGVDFVRRFWKGKGLAAEELAIQDGSGLSPANRVTTHAQVEILKYAKGRDWYPSFYNALPEYNGMKMKSGTIGGVKGFCGYHKASNGREYIFSFLVNNYSGSSSTLVSKMYKVLDVLK